LEFVAEHTWQVKERLWAENLAENLPVIRRSGDAGHLPMYPYPILVIGAGPSVQKHGQLPLIGERWGGKTIAVDRILKPCIEAGITPDYVVTADADESVAGFYDGLGGGETRAVLHVFSHPRTLERCPYERFFYLTPLDDPTAPRSLTRLIHLMTGGKVIFSSFGNAGGQAVNLALFLGASEVIMVGLDYGYPADFPLEETPYFRSYEWLAKRRGKRVERFFTRVRNPDTREEVVLDLNWIAYREVFLKHMRMLRGRRVRVINCSPTSSLFGEGIEFMDLEEAIQRWGR